jgi:hypothetical protein
MLRFLPAINKAHNWGFMNPDSSTRNECVRALVDFNAQHRSLFYRICDTSSDSTPVLSSPFYFCSKLSQSRNNNPEVRKRIDMLRRFVPAWACWVPLVIDWTITHHVDVTQIDRIFRGFVSLWRTKFQDHDWSFSEALHHAGSSQIGRNFEIVKIYVSRYSHFLYFASGFSASFFSPFHAFFPCRLFVILVSQTADILIFFNTSFSCCTWLVAVVRQFL